MIKRYRVKRWSTDGGVVYDSLEEVKDVVYDVDLYIDNSSDSIYDGINDSYQGFSFGGRSWSATEVLDALDSDYLSEIVREDAESRCSDDLPYEYDDQLEELEIGDTLRIDETGCYVELFEIIPESEEEEEELGINRTDMEAEAAALL